MRRGFLLSNPRKTAPPTTRRPAPRPSPSSNEHSAKKNLAAPPSTELIPLPAKFISRPTPPEYPPDFLQRTRHIAQVPERGGSPEELTVFIHYDGVLEALEAEYPGWPLPFSTPSPPVYKIVPIEGAGLGMVATADIGVGELIVRERPLLLAPRAFHARVPGEASQAIVDAVNTMHPENKRLFYTLKNVKGNTVSEEMGLINTNAYMCGPFPAYNGRYGGVAREALRANHSCCPNAEHSFDAATLTQSLRARRPIRAGEEITVPYVTLSSAAADRQEELSRRYFFKCVCESCRLTGEERKQSDVLRAYIRLNTIPAMVASLDAAFDAWLAENARARPPVAVSAPFTAMDPLSITLSLWEAMTKERWIADELWEPVLMRLVKAYSVFEDEERVRYYATKAAELRTLHTESDGGWRAVAASPRMTEWWAKYGAKRKA